MKIVPNRQTWTQQPQFYRNVNWANPIANGLAALFNTSAALELVYNNPASSVTTTNTAGGGLLGADFSSTANQQYSHRPGYAITGELTIFVLMNLRAATNYGAILAKQQTTTTNAPYELRLGSSGATTGEVQLLRANTSTYNTARAGSTGQNLVSLNTLTALFVRAAAPSSSAQVDFLVNGVQYSSEMNLASVTDNGSAVWIGRRYDGVTQLDGRIFYVSLWNRLLSLDEQKSLTNNPWQLFLP